MEVFPGGGTPGPSCLHCVVPSQTLLQLGEREPFPITGNPSPSLALGLGDKQRNPQTLQSAPSSSML